MAPDTTRQPSRYRLTDLLDGQFMARLDNLDVFSRKVLRGKLQGERRSKRRGQGVEFADHRPYTVGDDLRFIDWNIYGRLDKLFLKLFLEDQDLTVHVMLDLSASANTGDPSKAHAAKKLAAALSYVALVNNNRLTVTTFADGVTGQLANVRGRAYLPRLAELLVTTRPEGPSQLEKACRQVSETRLGVGLMIVVSDFLLKEGYDAGLKRLLSRNYDLYAIQMLSPQELKPDLAGDLRLIDMEDDDEAEVTISGALLKFYQRNLSAWCGGLRDFCIKRGATYALASSADPVEPFVLTHLRKLGLLR